MKFGADGPVKTVALRDLRWPTKSEWRNAGLEGVGCNAPPTWRKDTDGVLEGLNVLKWSLPEAKKAPLTAAFDTIQKLAGENRRLIGWLLTAKPKTQNFPSPAPPGFHGSFSTQHEPSVSRL